MFCFRAFENSFCFCSGRGAAPLRPHGSHTPTVARATGDITRHRKADNTTSNTSWLFVSYTYLTTYIYTEKNNEHSAQHDSTQLHPAAKHHSQPVSNARRPAGGALGGGAHICNIQRKKERTHHTITPRKTSHNYTTQNITPNP